MMAPMTPEQIILAVIRRGGTPTWAQTCACMATREELVAYQAALAEHGRLDAEALRAIRDRLAAIERREAAR